MKIGRNYVILAVLILLIAIIGLWALSDKKLYTLNDSNNQSCRQDADCVPASFCHADKCMNKAYKTDCSGVFCSQECKIGTLDCGQASCGCVNKKCSVVAK